MAHPNTLGAVKPTPRVSGSERSRLNLLRRQIVQAAHAAGEGHVPSALSILDLLWVLYNRVMNLDPSRPCDPEFDRFVLSKGHASLALYVVLAEAGFFPLRELESFCQLDSKFGGHPDRNKVPGVEASTGSLGHGFPIAVGMALAGKIRSLESRVFCLLGDGECNEGTVWESAMLAAHHGLANLCCVVDYNHSTDRALSLGDIAAKFKSFGWEARSIAGHDHEAIYAALSHRPEGAPLMVVAETIKGYGVRQMEGEPAWHHRAPSDEELTAILADLA
jgi:transketolase